MQRSSTPYENQQFDLLVCGGGIYGAWTAYDAALRGLKVIIVDQGDWACGTSSASSKLVHGGLRYLETFDFSVVKKSLTERQLLIDLAPYRVWPLRFGVPVNKQSRIGSFRLKIGLLIYDFLAGTFHSRQTHRRFNNETFLQRFPHLNKNGLRCGYTYLDAQTDDARLVLEVIDAASIAGASCLNYCQVTDIIKQKGVITAAKLVDEVSTKTYTIKTKAVVKTVGQWISATSPQWTRLSKGVHLVLPKILKNEALLLTAQSDGRVFFIIPWYGQTLLGTTDTNYKGDINQLLVETKEIEYLLKEANLALNTRWTEKDIQGQFAGLRVLQQSTQSSPSRISRDWEVKSEKGGLYYSIGGKLTSSREDAAQLVDEVCQYLGNDTRCQSAKTALPWMPAQHFKDWLAEMTQLAQDLGVDKESTLWLLRRHGKHAQEILQHIEQVPLLAKRITATVPLIMADFNYCLEHEMVYHLEDLLRRRVPLLILYRMTKIELQQFASLCAKTFNWNQQRIDQEVKLCAEKWLLD